MKFIFQHKNSLFPIVLFLIIIIAFLTLQPTSASTNIPQKQEHVWTAFLEKEANAKRFQTQEFWQTREFYSPGTFTFDVKGLPGNDAEKLLRLAGMHTDFQNVVFNKYLSQKFVSYEMTVPKEQEKNILSQFNRLKQQSEVMASGENFVIVKEKGTQQALILFLASPEEMKKTNGYLEFTKENFLKEKLWLSISKVTL